MCSYLHKLKLRTSNFQVSAIWPFPLRDTYKGQVGSKLVFVFVFFLSVYTKFWEVYEELYVPYAM